MKIFVHRFLVRYYYNDILHFEGVSKQEIKQEKIKGDPNPNNYCFKCIPEKYKSSILTFFNIPGVKAFVGVAFTLSTDFFLIFIGD